VFCEYHFHLVCVTTIFKEEEEMGQVEHFIQQSVQKPQNSEAIKNSFLLKFTF
jgi:hypothetical protein